MENKRNFQRELENVLDGVSEKPEKPALLLHSCCGPCSSYVLEYLSRYFKITLFFFNPNIHPLQEYQRRLEAQYKVVREMGLESCVEIIEGDYCTEEFFSRVKGLESEPEGGKRCEECIRMRMERASEEALKRNSDYFATTLTVSPHKNAVYINAVGEFLESEGGAGYLVSDFKKKNGYKRSIELCRIHDIYRQNYCGCVYSDWRQSADKTYSK